MQYSTVQGSTEQINVLVDIYHFNVFVIFVHSFPSLEPVGYHRQTSSQLLFIFVLRHNFRMSENCTRWIDIVGWLCVLILSLAALFRIVLLCCLSINELVLTITDHVQLVRR